jgi:hypothetical protein
MVQASCLVLANVIKFYPVKLGLEPAWILYIYIYIYIYI